jgi:hypothetical protein
LLLCAGLAAQAAEPVLVPQVDGAWWQVAGDPDLGKFTTPKQQPVDFSIWQATDGTWQLWSCIRSTACGGKTRLFYGWEGAKLTDKDWQPKGIVWQADPNFGETEGGVQSPFVTKFGVEYYLSYGDWENICLARSFDGKTFARWLMPNGKSGMFSEGLGAQTRDPMLLRIGNRYYMYTTANPKQIGADYVRTSTDLRHWSATKKIAFAGAAGTGPYTAECPFVYFHKASGYYYLFRTQHYGENAQTSVYRSKDPTYFGVNDDHYLIGTIPYAAPEIIEYEGQTYIGSLVSSLKGIQVAKLKWAPKQ